MGNPLQRNEWAQWREVCRQLLALGAVTQEDLDASERDYTTPGRQLLTDLRAWGSLRVRVAKEQDAD